MRLFQRVAATASVFLCLAGCSQERPPGVFTPDPVAPPPSLSRSLKVPPPPATRAAGAPVRRGLEVPR